MRSGVLLLLLAALSAARLRLGSAEVDPLPSSLVHLLRTSSISSVEDLKLLLETGALEEDEEEEEEDEEDEHDLLLNQTHGRLTRSLVEAQPAQQAVCKVRTEVMEVTRSMLDRRNANFLLWPPCVEVQRCSGCCNTRLLQCVPIVSSTRFLQVIKIQYMNKKAHYDKAIISVEDHVSCRCQLSSSSSSSSSSAPIQSNPNPLPPPPSSHLPPPLLRTVHPAPPKTHASKADLHRHDDLKHNQQRHRPEDPVARRWQQGSYTQLAHWTPPRPSEARAEHSVMVGHGSGSDGSREESGVHPAANGGGEVHHPDHVQRQQQLLQHQQRQQQHHHQPVHRGGGAEDRELRTQHRLDTPQSDGAAPPGGPTLEKDPAPPATTNQTEVTTQTATVTSNQTTGGGEREKSGSAHSGEPANRGIERDSKVGGGFGHLTEEDRRRKVLEMTREPEHQTLLHPHHPQQRPEPTTFKTAPVSPFRPAAPRRRRKHRRRISKAAIRAMIM